jgi:hypothetical protein
MTRSEARMLRGEAGGLRAAGCWMKRAGASEGVRLEEVDERAQ